MKEDLSAAIEYALIVELRPRYIIAHRDEQGVYQIILSHDRFKDMRIDHRLTLVFKLIEKHVPKAFEEKVIVQAFSNEEMLLFFEFITV